MNKYWIFCNADKDGNILISEKRYDGGYNCSNPYLEMSDQEIRRYFANKAKYVAQLYLHDNNMNPYSNFNADNDENCNYMGGHFIDDVTIGQIYNFYVNNK